MHRLRFDNSEMASAVYVEMRERERKKPVDAYRTSTGAEAPSDPSQLPAGQLIMTHARLLTGADIRAAPGFPSGAIVYYEVRLRAPGHEGHILALDEQVDHPAGTRLLFLHGERLVDGSVEQRVRARRFEIQLASTSSQPHSAGPATTTTTKTTIQVDLNGMNHCEQRFRDAAEYESERVAHCEKLAASLELVEDAITGKKLKIREQLLYIDLHMTSASTGLRTTWDGIKQAKDIALRLLANSARHRHGAVEPPPVLVCAGPGTGKTWSALQLAHEIAVLSGGPTSTSTGDSGPFAPVPLLIFVQRLSRHVREVLRQGKPAGKDDLLRLYIEAEYSQHEPQRELMLKQAMALRSLIIVIDGVDEASGLEQLIEDFVLKTLVPGGYRLVVTSRPTGIRRAKYEGTFAIFDLKPLSDEQMKQVIHVRWRRVRAPRGCRLTWLHLHPALRRCSASLGFLSTCSPSLRHGCPLRTPSSPPPRPLLAPSDTHSDTPSSPPPRPLRASTTLPSALPLQLASRASADSQ